MSNQSNKNGEGGEMSNYCMVLINSTSKKEADKIIVSLLKKRLVAGANIYDSPAKFWWKGKIEEYPYLSITAYTKKIKINQVVEEIKKLHKDEVPGITFHDVIDGNLDFLDWIKKEVR